MLWARQLCLDMSGVSVYIWYDHIFGKISAFH